MAPGARDPAPAGPPRAEVRRHRAVGDPRGVRRPGAGQHQGRRPIRPTAASAPRSTPTSANSPGTGSIRTAARWRSATRSPPPARASSARRPRSWRRCRRLARHRLGLRRRRPGHGRVAGARLTEVRATNIRALSRREVSCSKLHFEMAVTAGFGECGSENRRPVECRKGVGILFELGATEDGLRHRVGHRSVAEGAEEPPLPVHREIARSPDDRRTDVTREHGIGGGTLVDDAREVLWMNRPASGRPTARSSRAARVFL